ncbi:MAG: hypothetical protein P1P84_10330 [Deferrisomatales bacterium]|nr:hypothetical protein [Deferrisomatales bacterium]
MSIRQVLGGRQTGEHVTIQDFVDKWKASGGAERANYQLFLSELCDVLDVPHPDPTVPDDTDNEYVFERAVTFRHGDGTTSTGFIDLYRRGCFVLEAKQGTERQEALETGAPRPLPLPAGEEHRARKKGTAVRGTGAWDSAMLRARGQAEAYARALPVAEGRPPFVVVVDVGHSIELFSEFSRTGGTYVPFPEPRRHRVFLDQLADESVRETLRLVWTDPLALDPTRRSARVTREIADRLARLARSLETAGHDPHAAAGFLMRCLFTMFAEDVGLLPDNSFTGLLEELRRSPAAFAPTVEELWQKMATGGFSAALRTPVRRFNGGLFEEAAALPLDEAQVALLLEAARADWRDVEPTIFGTLLERALDPAERHKLGAHFTPRAYVERLVLPTVVEPLREEWAAVQVAALTLDQQGKTDAAAAELEAFHRRLCKVRVLDPACGSGNFLYVALEHLKRLEGEVQEALAALGRTQTSLDLQGLTVDPHQLLGLEVNPRAAAIAELCLWIGFLQWHFRNRGSVMPAEPVLQSFHNIECRDAVLAWDATEPVLGEDGETVTRWDGVTTKTHPVTGKEVPDETARVPLLQFRNPRRADWPEADFVVGNPPFIGNWRMRQALGDGYTEALRATHDDVPESVDYVMYWWNHAAHLAREGRLRRFGLITTNSLRQVFARQVLRQHLEAEDPLSLVFAVPDHPWVDSGDGADVRIAMTVAEPGTRPGTLREVVGERRGQGDEAEVLLSRREGQLRANLTVGADVGAAVQLRANDGLCCPGVKLHGSGFIVTPEEACVLGFGRVPGLERHIRPYLNGRDLNQRPRDVMVIDLFGLDAEQVRERFPEVFQWVVERVKPERDARAGRTKDADGYARLWWLFGKPRQELRKSLSGLPRYIATTETSKHRFFVFLDHSILPDNMLVNMALADAFFLGVLSSRVHVVWTLASGGTLEDRPRYNKTRCFDPFPFPEYSEGQRETVRRLAEQLDAHRKRQLALHDDLTLTKMYNVLEKLRAGEELSPADRTLHERGLVSVLRQLHDELDAAVFAAFGWPADLGDEEVLERLVALNRERAEEERRGRVRWLRPEFQNPGGLGAEQLAVEGGRAAATAAQRVEKRPWPGALAEQARGVLDALRVLGVPATAEDVAKTFRGARRSQVSDLLETLASLGQAHRLGGGRFGVG